MSFWRLARWAKMTSPGGKLTILAKDCKNIKLRNDMSRKSQTVLYSSNIILKLGLLVMKEMPIGRHVKSFTLLNAFNQ
jgi:hypothetical protein